METSKISWNLGYTLNTGNFQSLRLDCSVEDYVREGETTQDASNRVYTFVEEQLVSKLKEAKEELN
jgi:methyl coenzyme M reductase subunit D